MTAATLMASTGSQGSRAFGLCTFQVTEDEKLSFQFDFLQRLDNRDEIRRAHDESIQSMKPHARHGRQRERIQFQPVSKLPGDVSVPMTTDASILMNGFASMGKEKH